MSNRALSGILGALVLLVLLGAAATFWMLSEDAPPADPGRETLKASTPDAERAEIPTRSRENAPASQAPGENTAPTPETPPPDRTPPDFDPETYLPPPPPVQPQPPAESEEGETIAPAFRTEDLSGQALQVHRDLEQTLRVLHDLLR
jgi:hypothetical protein